MPSYLGNISSVPLNKLVNDLENIEFDNLDTNFHEHLTLRPYFVHYNEYSYLSCRFIIFVRFKFKKDSTFLKAIKFRSDKHPNRKPEPAEETLPLKALWDTAIEASPIKVSERTIVRAFLTATVANGVFLSSNKTKLPTIPSLPDYMNLQIRQINYKH